MYYLPLFVGGQRVRICSLWISLVLFYQEMQQIRKFYRYFNSLQISQETSVCSHTTASNSAFGLSCFLPRSPFLALLLSLPEPGTTGKLQRYLRPTEKLRQSWANIFRKQHLLQFNVERTGQRELSWEAWPFASRTWKRMSLLFIRSKAENGQQVVTMKEKRTG